MNGISVPPTNEPLLTEEKINLVRRTVAKDATDDELQMFLHVARSYHLDPFIKEICFIKRKVWNSYKQGYDEVPTIMVTRDGHMSVAHKSGQFGGIKTTPEFDDKGNLVSATCRVWNKSCTEPVEVTVYYKEYVALNKDGKPQALWGSKPITMLSKVAESQALRKAFNFHGMYAPEEMEAELQKDAKSEIEHMTDGLEVSKALNSPDAYERWSEETMAKIMDKINECDTIDQLRFVERCHKKDLTQLVDKDREYMMERFGSALSVLLNHVEPDVKEIKSGSIKPPDAPQSTIENHDRSLESEVTIKPERNPQEELALREADGQEFLKRAVEEIGNLKTKAALTVWIQKNGKEIMGLVAIQREYIESMIASAKKRFVTP